MRVIGNRPLLFAIGALGFSGTGCGIVAPSCVDHVTTTVRPHVRSMNRARCSGGGTRQRSY